MKGEHRLKAERTIRRVISVLTILLVFLVIVKAVNSYNKNEKIEELKSAINDRCNQQPKWALSYCLDGCFEAEKIVYGILIVFG